MTDIEFALEKRLENSVHAKVMKEKGYKFHSVRQYEEYPDNYYTVYVNEEETVGWTATIDLDFCNALPIEDIPGYIYCLRSELKIEPFADIYDEIAYKLSCATIDQRLKAFRESHKDK